MTTKTKPLIGRLIIVTDKIITNLDTILSSRLPGLHSVPLSIYGRHGVGFFQGAEFNTIAPSDLNMIQFLNELQLIDPDIKGAFFINTASNYGHYTFACSNDTEKDLANKLMNDFIEDVTANVRNSKKSISWL